MCWINWDPLEEEGSVNLTSFIGNNPFIGIDPMGEAVKVTINPTPIRKSKIDLGKGSTEESPRAITCYVDTLKFSCDEKCIMHVHGEMQLWIELLEASSKRWWIRYP